jgi:hypothetical protein
MLAPSEKTMWRDDSSDAKEQLSHAEINQKYVKRELRIITETNREQLPNFVMAMKREGWLKLQPFYQRHQRWDQTRKSKLIESFIMNIPVPPCFLFESDFSRYEVMDGQQRISAISEFYDNRLKLKGLEQWPELNGMFYLDLPSEIRKGLDRRSISYIVLLKESATTKDEEMLLRQQVFERLNTGGIELENQEVRHCIYHNKFDTALIDLSRHELMRRTWDLPLFTQEEVGNPPAKLLMNQHFSKMRDVEFVLRFFALRHVERYRGGMHRFLDQYMVRTRIFSDDDIEFLKNDFRTTIELAGAIFDGTLFKPWTVKTNEWSQKPQIAYADALLVALSEVLVHGERLTAQRDAIVEAAKQMVIQEPSGTFTGQGNTKESVKARIQVFRDLFNSFVRQN